MVTSCPSAGTIRGFFSDLHNNPGGAQGGTIHQSVESSLRLGPQEFLSVKLLYSQSSAIISQLPFKRCYNLLALVAVSVSNKLRFSAFSCLSNFWVCCNLSSLLDLRKCVQFAQPFLVVRTGLMIFMVFTCWTKCQKYICSLFNSCKLLSPLLYRNYSKVNNE